MNLRGFPIITSEFVKPGEVLMLPTQLAGEDPREFWARAIRESGGVILAGLTPRAEVV